MVAYDAHVVERPGEEDALARLVAHSRPLRSIRPVVGLLFGCLRLVSSASLVLSCPSVQPLECRCVKLQASLRPLGLFHAGFDSGIEENSPSKALFLCLFCSRAVIE